VSKPFTMWRAENGDATIHRKGAIITINKSKKGVYKHDTDQNVEMIRSQHGNTQPIEFFGIFGTFDVNSHSYIILISEASLVGDIMGAEVFRVEQLKFLPLDSQSEQIHKQDQQYIDMLKNLQKPRTFYFSYKMDLTKRVQVIVEDLISNKIKEDALRMQYPNSVGYVEKFAFNHNLLEDL